MFVNLVDFDDPWPGFLGVTSGMSTTVWRARHKARWCSRSWNHGWRMSFCMGSWGAAEVGPYPKCSALEQRCKYRVAFDIGIGSFDIAR